VSPRRVQKSSPRTRLKKLEAELVALRARAGKLQRQEAAVWRRIETLLGKPEGRLTSHTHAAARGGGAGPRPPVGSTGKLSAIARMAGSTGLFCGCPPIRIQPQPNGDVDVCVLIECSNDPATSGFHCSYWCGTLVAEPIVAIARSARGRRRKAR